MEGMILIDKPKEWTSFDVVNYIRRMVAQVEGKKPMQCKVGHTGTLDPLATGLMVVLIGKNYTRKAVDLGKVDKTYDVIMTLGQTSTTGDEEGEKTAVSADEPNILEIEDALQHFTGTVMQTPPIYSAIKVDGKRAYELAREGKEVEMKAREARIYHTTLISYDYPHVHFATHVGSGTYIRSLVSDIGDLLKTGAYTSELRRTKVGKFDIAHAHTIDSLSAEELPGLLRQI